MSMIQLVNPICLIMSYVIYAFDVILWRAQYFTNLSDYNITEKNENSESKVIARVIRDSTLCMVEFIRSL